MSTEMDSACRKLSCFYNLVMDKTREAELRGSWSLAILDLLASPRYALVRGARDSQARSLPHLFLALWPARCSVGLTVELYDL